MDNTNTQPQIITPDLPHDIESRLGSTKTELVEAVLELVRRSVIIGVHSQTSDIVSLNARVTALESQVGTNAPTIAVMQEQIADHEQRLDNAESKLNGHGSRITSLETLTNTHTTQIADHEARIDVLEP